ncbi:fungal-specific transcription factor domain-containing protein [Phyllosticta citriasiana]|uniref:Fungal-specific transcription factor domain-containing protein n=1 Tax=Phyllosticta citriasiana TaxID=595635 RepID=A0ABR1L1I0_9PEZI
MTSPKPSSAPTPINSAATPRKRRRRAVATGATEDCFTCRQRQAKCDRRRPYCTQCIEMGKECSGYRTTLTWGVGVASRGKLRGMSCPVPKSPSSTISSSRENSTQATARKPSVSLPSPPTSTVSRKQPLRQPYAQPSQKSPSPIHSPTGQEHASMDATSPVHIPPPAVPYQGWHLPSFGEHVESFGGAGRKSRPQFPPKPLQRLHTTLAVPFDDSALSTSTGPLSSHGDSALGDYPSPSDFPGTPDDFHFADPIMHNYPEHLLPSRTPISSTESLIFPDAPRSFPVMYEDLSSSISSDQSLHELHDMSSMQPRAYSQHPGYQDTFLPSALGAAAAAAGPNLTHISDSSYSRGTRPTSHALTETSGRFSEAAAALAELAMVGTRSVYSAGRHLSPRMQVLMDYYDRMICPALVAYDGPSNPYRVHVMGLAMESQALRNAIAALAVNNVRMRQNSEAKFVAMSKTRWSDHSPEWTRQRFSSEEIREMHGEPSEEERHYKATSIQLLNQQLADPLSAQHDSVLATLLVLCLFHVSDSGFSKFRTQLEGVKRLLSLREQRTSFTAWIEMFFTWFDVMTSTVNDRETQVRDDLLDAITESSSLGALEHLIGCDGRLFRIIARLGRLNLLSQNRPVSPRLNTPSDTTTSQLDGNGWAPPPPHPHMPNNTTPSDALHDHRHEFWAEWREIRQHLQQWELEPIHGAAAAAAAPPCSASLSTLSTSPHHHDVLHLSESFRYAALLYIERLAHPSLASASLNFQNLVAQALFHVSYMSPRSPVQKFLLWPLFITGTECVDPGHRAMVRAECVAIMRRSGFWNNLRGLEVLERVWSREDGDGDGDGAAGVAHDAGGRRAAAAAGLLVPCQVEGAEGWDRQAFRWRRAMERTDGEYMLV